MTIMRRLPTGLLVLLALAALWMARPAAQTGILMPMPQAQFFDNTGAPCNGCKLFSYAAGTTTKLSTYTDSALSVANTNPIVLSAAGRATVYLNPTLSYKFVLAPPTDTDPPSAAYYSQDNIIGPYSNVLTVSAADTRGLRVTRSSAEAGASFTSSGGSGKTYGLASMTTGEFRIQDESDSTPRFALIGNNITNTLTGTFGINGGLLSVTGFGAHDFTASGTGTQTLTVRNASNGTSNATVLNIGNDSSAAALSLTTHATSSLFGGGHSVIDQSTGDLYIRATNAGGDIFFASGGAANIRATIASNGRIALASSHAPLTDVDVRSSSDGVAGGGNGGFAVTRADGTYTIINTDDGGASAFGQIQSGDGSAFRPLKLQPNGSVVLMPSQPAFLAVNTGLDILVTDGSTVDFDSEVYDIAGNFAADTFTAPVTGIYHFCTMVTFSDNANEQLFIYINTAGVLNAIYANPQVTAGSGSGCVDAGLTAGQTASVSVATTDTGVDIDGSASPRVTWFSGRLVQ